MRKIEEKANELFDGNIERTIEFLFLQDTKDGSMLNQYMNELNESELLFVQKLAKASLLTGKIDNKKSSFSKGFIICNIILIIAIIFVPPFIAKIYFKDEFIRDFIYYIRAILLMLCAGSLAFMLIKGLLKKYPNSGYITGLKKCILIIDNNTVKNKKSKMEILSLTKRIIYDRMTLFFVRE